MTNNLKTKSPPKDGLEYLDAPIKAPQWKNVFFDRNGKSYLGYRTFNSAEEAEARIKECHEDIITGRATAYACINGPERGQDWESGVVNRQLDVNNFSHAIQMPWGGK